MKAFEVNFDGLIGPTHNYGGLSDGNLASARNAGAVSSPRAAALQGLETTGRHVRNPEQVFGCMDHIVDTIPGRTDATMVPGGSAFITTTRAAAKAAGVQLFDLGDEGKYLRGDLQSGCLDHYPLLHPQTPISQPPTPDSAPIYIQSREGMRLTASSRPCVPREADPVAPGPPRPLRIPLDRDRLFRRNVTTDTGGT